MRIYLDFDGVMHPRIRDRIYFEHMEALEAILRENRNVQVVISSSWREVFKFEEMRDYFAEDVADQIIGVTPVLKGKSRCEEVMQHLLDTGYGGNFIVLDDDASEFPADWPPLLLCDPAVGLNAPAQARLRSMLSASASQRVSPAP